MDCAYTKYEPIFGSWHITRQLGQGSEGQLFEISRKDALGHVSFSAMKAITIPGDEEAQKAVLARGIRKEDLEAYYQDAVSNNVKEYRLMYKLKGNSHIVSYEDHQIIRHTDDAGWDILIRIEKLTPLIDHVLENPLSAADVAQMGADICEGLVYCQKNGIVHRDIKPDNIFLADSGDYKLGDFGIAQILEYTHTAYSRKGTYTYMAPEVYRGTGYGITVDIYSLGLVMYKYLNDGRNPFLPPYPEMFTPDDEDVALAMRITGKDLPAPAHGSEELQRIVLKACSFESEDRYQNAQEMLKDLQKLIADENWGDESDSKAGGVGQSGSEDGSRTGHGRPAKRTKRTNPETGRLSAGQRRRQRMLAIAVTAIIVCAAVAGAVIWKMTPKKITEISGISADTKIYIGDTLKPDYTILPERFADEPITFASSDENVLTVDKNGALHALAVGDAVLTLKAKNYSREITVSVIPKVTNIAGISDTIELETGKSTVLKPLPEPEKFAGEKVTYTVKDPKVATVSEAGEIKAVKAGETNVTVSAGGFVRTITVKVTDPAPEEPAAGGEETSSGQTTQPAAANRGDYSGGGQSTSGASGTGASGGAGGSAGGNTGGSSAGNSGSSGGEYFDDSAEEYFE